MSKYDIIFEKLQDKVDSGELTIEDAQILNDAAYEKYVTEFKVDIQSEIVNDQYFTFSISSTGTKAVPALSPNNLYRSKSSELFSPTKLNVVFPLLVLISFVMYCIWWYSGSAPTPV